MTHNVVVTGKRRRPRVTVRMGCAMLAAAVFLAGCGTPPPGRFRRAPLVGIVSDGEGRPVAGAEVTLDGRRTAHTGMDGRFTFSRVRRGRHEVGARSAGFEEASVELAFTDRRQIAYVRLISNDHLIERAVDYIAAGDLAAATGMLERVSVLDGSDGEANLDAGLDADVALLEAIVRSRRGDRRGALEALEPLRADPRTRAAAERLSAAIRDAPSRTE
ncbi:MAG: carboxypeptidase-like regulatory domain-containing protein [Spirochaetia bacterium]